MAGAAVVHGFRRPEPGAACDWGIRKCFPSLHPGPVSSPLPPSPPWEQSHWEQLASVSHGPAPAGEGPPSLGGARGLRSWDRGKSVPPPGPLRLRSRLESGLGGRARGVPAAGRRGRKFSSVAAQPFPPRGPPGPARSRFRPRCPWVRSQAADPASWLHDGQSLDSVVSTKEGKMDLPHFIVLSEVSYACLPGVDGRLLEAESVSFITASPVP